MAQSKTMISQITSLLKITQAKLDEAKENGPAALGSTVVKEVLSSLSSCTAILDRLEKEDSETPPTQKKAAQPAAQPAQRKPEAKIEKAPKKALRVPKLGAIDASEMEI